VSRVDELRARLAGEIAVAELEDKLIAAKADPKVKPEALRDLKVRLRQARAEYRTRRAGNGTASAQTVGVSVNVGQEG
jgi:hypothetical protein